MLKGFEKFNLTLGNTVSVSLWLRWGDSVKIVQREENTSWVRDNTQWPLPLAGGVSPVMRWQSSPLMWGQACRAWFDKNGDIVWHLVIFLIKNIFSFVPRTARNKWFRMSPGLMETGGVFSFALGAFLTCREHPGCQISRESKWLSLWKPQPAFPPVHAVESISSPRTVFQSNLGTTEMLRLHLLRGIFIRQWSFKEAASGTCSSLLSVYIFGFCCDFIWRGKITNRVWRAQCRKRIGTWHLY